MADTWSSVEPQSKQLTPEGQKPVADKPPVGRPTTSSRFSEVLAKVEAHRQKVRVTLGIAMLVRLVLEFQMVTLVREPANLVAELPYIGMAMLSYMVVLWFLAARTRDRQAFGMALGIAVLQSTYLIVMLGMSGSFAIAAAWPSLAVVVAHLPMAYFAFDASKAYPPLDSKKPWIIGFATSVVFLAIPWVAPALMAAVNKHA